MSTTDYKIKIWHDFCRRFDISSEKTEIFSIQNGHVELFEYGRSKKR